MKNILTIITSLVLLSLTNSCKKDPSTFANAGQLWDCNKAQEFDSTKLADKLIGSWQWTETSSETATKQADKNIRVTFTSAGKFTVTENSTIITHGNWQMKIVDSGILGLSMDNPSEFLHGRILLCGNQVLFNNSFRDGADNLFTRTN